MKRHDCTGLAHIIWWAIKATIAVCAALVVRAIILMCSAFALAFFGYCLYLWARAGFIVP